VALVEHSLNNSSTRFIAIGYFRTRLICDENGRLKKIVAQQALDLDALKVVLSKKW